MEGVVPQQQSVQNRGRIVRGKRAPSAGMPSRATRAATRARSQAAAAVSCAVQGAQAAAAVPLAAPAGTQGPCDASRGAAQLQTLFLALASVAQRRGPEEVALVKSCIAAFVKGSMTAGAFLDTLQKPLELAVAGSDQRGRFEALLNTSVGALRHLQAAPKDGSAGGAGSVAGPLRRAKRSAWKPNDDELRVSIFKHKVDQELHRLRALGMSTAAHDEAAEEQSTRALARLIREKKRVVRHCAQLSKKCRRATKRAADQEHVLQQQKRFCNEQRQQHEQRELELQEQARLLGEKAALLERHRCGACRDAILTVVLGPCGHGVCGPCSGGPADMVGRPCPRCSETVETCTSLR